MWTVDASRPGGVAAVVNSWLRASLFHELHHLTRASFEQPRSIVEHAVFEGMATAFERDFAGARTPWGDYPNNVDEWARELRSVPANSPLEHWLYSHPDGRRWAGIKVGTYWTDRAMKELQQSSAALVGTPTDEILRITQ